MVMPRHPEFHIFIEGGGQGRLRSEARQGFGQFFEKAVLGARKPKVTACGTRRHAYEDFCEAIKHSRAGDIFLLLVDSEAPFTAIQGANGQSGFWRHVATRPGDGWPQPPGANDDMLHFMVECMENWFLADQDAMHSHFGNGFNKNALGKMSDVESISKQAAYDRLAKATQGCRSQYAKGRHSFALIAHIDPVKLAKLAPYARRVIECVRQLSGATTPLF